MKPNDITCLANIREKIKGEEKLTPFQPILTDDFLLSFIRGRKYKVDYAFETVKQYFYLRQKKYRDLFLEIMPSKLIYKYVLGKPLKQYGPEGQVVVVVKREWIPTLETIHADKFWPEMLLKQVVVTAGEMLKNQHFHINGVEVVADLGTLKFAEIRFLLMHIHYIPMLINIFHKAFPLRVRKIHLINAPSYVYWVIKSVLVPLDPAGYFFKTQFHYGDLKSLHKRLPRDILPEFLNGFVPEDEAYWEDFTEKALQCDDDFVKLHHCIKSVE